MGLFPGVPEGRELGGSESVARCDDVTEMITVEGKYSHADAVCVGMIESRCEKRRVAGIIPEWMVWMMVLSGERDKKRWKN